MSALRANTSTQTVSPFLDISANNVLLQTNPDFNQSLLEFIHILERRLIDLLMHFVSADHRDQIFMRSNLQFVDVCCSFQCIFRLFCFPQVV